jgi:hypothetical protein
MKRASVACAAFVILGTAACGSSNPTVPPGAVPDDAGASERGASMPPDLRPPAVDLAGADATVVPLKDASVADTPLSDDAASDSVYTGAPAIVTVSILDPVAGGSADGGGAAVPVIATSARFTPSVRVDVRSQGGDPTADIVTKVTAALVKGSATGSSVASVTLNQTQYEVVPESSTKAYLYGDTPFSLDKVPTGAYSLLVTATTAGGTEATASVAVFVDGGPSITFLQPDEGVFVKGSIIVTAVVLDESAGVTSVEFSVGQVQIPASAIVSNGAQYSLSLDFGSFNPPLEGPQVVMVTAVNGNGVVSLASRKFTVDTQGPTITSTKPATGDLIGKLITIEASVADEAGVMEDSVVAVVAHGDVHFEVHLTKGASGKYAADFDTTQLPSYALFPSISFRAQDELGNQSSVGYLVSLDNTPPVLDLDPPANVRLLKKDGICSWPFDPVGPDAIDDGSVVNQLFDVRARIEDLGNTPRTGIPDFVPIGGIDKTSVKVLILDDTSLPLVVDTSDPPDGICDDINPELVPSVAPQSAKDAQLLDMVSLPAKAGQADFSPQPGVACSSESGEPPAPGTFCETTYSPTKNRVMTYSMGYAKSLPAIWAVPPVVGDGLQCAGRQFDAANNLHDGWACVAVVAADELGNKQVSRPIRICVAAEPNSTACPVSGRLTSVYVPSSATSQLLVATNIPLMNAGGVAIASGDALVFTGVSPSTIDFLEGIHQVAPTGTVGTQYAMLDVTPAPYYLWTLTTDTGQDVYTLLGPVAVFVADGTDIQVLTDTPATVLPSDFTGKVILTVDDIGVTTTDQQWAAGNIQPSGFSLTGSAVSLGGAVIPAAMQLPDCTGTVVKTAPGAPAKVDGTVPCKPWASFPDYEVIEVD